MLGSSPPRSGFFGLGFHKSNILGSYLIIMCKHVWKLSHLHGILYGRFSKSTRKPGCLPSTACQVRKVDSRKMKFSHLHRHLATMTGGNPGLDHTWRIIPGRVVRITPHLYISHQVRPFWEGVKPQHHKLLLNHGIQVMGPDPSRVWKPSQVPTTLPLYLFGAAFDSHLSNWGSLFRPQKGTLFGIYIFLAFWVFVRVPFIFLDALFCRLFLRVVYIFPFRLDA